MFSCLIGSIPRRLLSQSILVLFALWASFAVTSQELHPQKIEFIPPVKTDIPAQEFERYLAATQSVSDTILQPHPDKSDVSNTQAGAQYLNSLILSNSPYLIKHASNPINWQVWSSETLQRAKSENKLIFLSIGFLTCYWCQMMEKESFVDTGIAEILNDNFVSIKVDRESEPELDQYMINALQQTKGTAGWPVTAILTSDSSIIFIDSYLEKAELASVLGNMAQVWRTQPKRLLSQSKLFARLLNKEPLNKEPFSPDSELGTEPIDTNKLVTDLKQHLDMQNGGLTGGPKFPEASLLYWLLDELRRKPDEDMAEFVKQQLKNMASKGMYDAIHGGFHRYVGDASWRIPHYEKMLYTQALMIQVYSRAYALFPDPFYEQVVQETLIFLKRFLATDQHTFYSGLDAVYQGEEGGYYLYQTSEIDSLKLTSEAFNGVTFYQKNGLVGIHANGLSRQSLQPIRQWAKPLRDKTLLQRDNKVITSWNALLISAMQSAWLAFGDEVYRTTALQLGESLYEMQFDDKVLYRVWYHKRTEQLATLEDYAFFIRGLLDLYDMSRDELWLDKAVGLMATAVQQLATSEKGFRFSNSETFTVSTMSLQDGELLNPQAVMLENIARLNARTGRQSWQDLGAIVSQQLSVQIKRSVLGQFYAAKVISDMQTDGELKRDSIASIGYFANGHGRIQLTSQPDESYLFTVTMDEHWHVNSHQPYTEELIPTRIHMREPGAEIFYPQAATLQFGPSKNPISVFQQAFSVVVKPSPNNAEGEKVDTKYAMEPMKTMHAMGIADVVVQACNDEQNLCLAPETVRLYSQ